MPDDAQRTLLSFTLPADTSRDTKVLWFFAPSSLPALLAAGAAALGAALLPLPLALKVPLVLGAPLCTGTALALDAPAKVRRWRRFRADSAARYVATPTDGAVRGRFADASLGVALAVLPPSATGRDADALEAERTAWVRAVRRLKAGRARMAVSVEMVPDAPPRPGWDVPTDLTLPPNAAHFADMRRTHFEALIAAGRALRPQVLLRIAGMPQAWDAQADLHLDRLANGVAGELQGVGAFALPIDLDALRQIGEAQRSVGHAGVEEGSGAVPAHVVEAAGAAAPRDDEAPARRGAGAVAWPRRIPSIALPALRLPCLAWRPHSPGIRALPPADEADMDAVPWPDVDALAMDAGRSWDIGLAVLGAVPRAGATTALLAWARGRPDARRWLLIDANLERAGGLALAAGAPSGLSGWLTGGGPDALTRAGGLALWGPGQTDSGDPADGDAQAARLLAACRTARERGVGQVAVDLGSPPPLTERLRAHLLVRLAATQAAAVAVVTRQDAAAVFAAQRLLSALRASGAAEVRVWVAAYDTADSVTLAELRAVFGCPVEEAPAPARLP